MKKENKEIESGYNANIFEFGKPMLVAKNRSKMRITIIIISSILIFWGVLSSIEKEIHEQGLKTEMNDQDILNKIVDENLIEIKIINLNEGDSSDLAFLKSIIGNAEIVLLGEQSHGDGTAFIAKAKIIKFLHEEMGFNVLAYESDFYQCNIKGDLFRKKKISIDEMKKSIWDFWTVGKEIQPFYEYLENENHSDNPLYLTGFDCQYFNCRCDKDFEENYLNYIKTFVPSEISSTDDYKDFETTISDLFSKPNNYKFSPEKQTAFFETLNKIIDIKKSNCSENEEFFLQEMLNLRGHAEFKWCSRNNKHIIRDGQMADNIKWLYEHKFKGEKIIIWAHSFHTLKKMSCLFPKEVIAEYDAEGINHNWIGHLMGEILYREYADKIYSIAFITYEGKYNEKAFKYNFEDTTEIISEANSLESMIHSKSIEYGFIDLKNTGNNAKIPDFIMSGDFHNEAAKANWQQVFDGLFYIDKMSGIKK